MNQKLIIRYLSRECTDKEIDLIERWLESSPENQKMMQELELIWKESGKNPPADEEFNVEADWLVLSYRMKKEESMSSHKSAQHQKAQRHPSGALTLVNTGWGQAVRIAAVILVAAVMGAFTWQNLNIAQSGEEGPSVREIAVEKGQRSNIILTDGTNVTLNADSRISLPETFRPNRREVYLTSGEAYFEVAGDPEKPFLIHSGGSVVRVLGTSFSVRYYPEDDGVRVVVKEGTVSLAPEHDENGGIVLTADQLGYYSEGSSVTSEEIDDVALFLSWTEGYLKFRDTPMKEVAVELERKYNIDVSFMNPGLEELRLTAELKGRSVYSVLDVISASLGIEYRETDRQGIVFGN
ncbi:MAG: FecR domain-containing protein [Balneolaceae bacterium]